MRMQAPMEAENPPGAPASWATQYTPAELGYFPAYIPPNPATKASSSTPYTSGRTGQPWVMSVESILASGNLDCGRWSRLETDRRLSFVHNLSVGDRYFIATGVVLPNAGRHTGDFLSDEMLVSRITAHCRDVIKGSASLSTPYLPFPPSGINAPGAIGDPSSVSIDPVMAFIGGIVLGAIATKVFV